jgi:SAM-dependent MidA family methyltransferase
MPPGGGPTAGDRLLESEPALVEALRAEILASGPITFARFMQRALYEPGLGYYAVPVSRIGREGDFLTAPEAHGLFGRTLAGQVAECWRRLDGPPRFTLREYGAGSGALASPLLVGLRDEAPEAYVALTYQPLEVNPYRLAGLRARLEGEGTADRLDPGSAIGLAPGVHAPAPPVPPVVVAEAASFHAAGVAPGPITGVVLANEFLDAFPVHRLEGRRQGLVEIGVGWRDGWFADEPISLSTPELAAYFDRVGVVLAEGRRGEVNLGIRRWIGEAAHDLERGWVIVIDYGMAAAELYSAHRPAGTLKGVSGHALEHDPYRRVGRQDLTAHVDLTELELAGCAAGLALVGTTTQARFLANLGLGERLLSAQRGARSIAEALETRSAGHWLLDPRGTGGFRVVVFGRHVAPEPPLLGLAGAAPDRS